MCMSWVEQLTTIEETFEEFFDHAYGLYEDLQAAETDSDGQSEE